MRRDKRTKTFNEEAETKKLIYISIAVIIIAIVVFAITYVAYSKVLSKGSKTVGDINSKIGELSSKQNEELYEASTQIGKSVNEVSSEGEQTNTQKIAINTANIEKEITNTVTSKEEKNKQEKTNTVSSNEILNKTSEQNAKETSNETKKKVPDPTFVKPLEGEIIAEFANENLVYSKTLKEWVTHNGIDIRGEKASIVKASSDGKVKFIKNDPRYGITVAIEHENGYESRYSNLLTAEFVKEGETIKQGQTIGTVGNTAVFEIADESHLHFEILKDGKYLNPGEYIK